MIATIKVEAANDGKDSYRELLLADYTKDTLNGVLALLWSLVAHSVADKESWSGVLQFSESGRTAPKDFNGQIIDRIRGLAEVNPPSPLPRMPASFSGRRRTRAAWLAERTWAYLILQSLAQIRGQYGFFRDIQSLLFLSAIHYLLPQLQNEGLRSEHDCLLHAMFYHTIIVWHDDPAQQFFLVSVLMDYLGQRDISAKLLEMSFRHTPPEDHSYVTKGQSVWFEYVQAGQHRAARAFLSHLARTAPQKYQAEIEEMRQEMKTYSKPNGR